MRQHLLCLLLPVCLSPSNATNVSVPVAPYQSGELQYTAQDVPDSVIFSNGIALYIRGIGTGRPPGPSNIENCVEETPMCLVARSSGAYRCGVRHTCTGGYFDYCYSPSFGTYHDPQDSDPFGWDSALLVYASPGGQDQGFPYTYGDTIWNQALSVPDSLYDSSAYATRRSTLFGVPVYFREYRCVGTLLTCYHAKVPSRGLVVYATAPGASLKSQISEVEIGVSSYTTSNGVCNEEYLSSLTIRWAADSAGNRRFLPSSNAAQRGIPASSPREQGIRIERSSGSVLVCFSSAVQNATLFDARGVAVAQTLGETSSLTVPSSRVKAGLYLLRVKRHGKVATIRVSVR